MMKTLKMKKGDDESDGDRDVQSNEHVSSFLTLHQFMSKGDMSLWIWKVVMSQITQIMRT